MSFPVKVADTSDHSDVSPVCASICFSEMDKAELQKELKLAQDKVANLSLLNKSAEHIIKKMIQMNAEANEKIQIDAKIIELYKTVVQNHEQETRKAEEEFERMAKERDELLDELDRKNENEEKLREENEEMGRTLEQYRNTAIAYKRKLKEQVKVTETKTSKAQVSQEVTFQDQLNGKWVYTFSQKSKGFELPQKFRSWCYGTLQLNLDGDKFSSSVIHRETGEIHESEVILGKTHAEQNQSEGWSCRGKTILEADHLGAFSLITWETSFCAKTPQFTDCRIERSIENGLLKIVFRVGDTVGEYTFKKCE